VKLFAEYRKKMKRERELGRSLELSVVIKPAGFAETKKNTGTACRLIKSSKYKAKLI
jgi:hypothetical protein